MTGEILDLIPTPVSYFGPYRLLCDNFYIARVHHKYANCEKDNACLLLMAQWLPQAECQLLPGQRDIASSHGQFPYGLPAWIAIRDLQGEAESHYGFTSIRLPDSRSEGSWHTLRTPYRTWWSYTYLALHLKRLFCQHGRASQAANWMEILVSTSCPSFPSRSTPRSLEVELGCTLLGCGRHARRGRH